MRDFCYEFTIHDRAQNDSTRSMYMMPPPPTIINNIYLDGIL